MKKIFALLFAALSVAFFACGDEKTDNGNDWFLAPAASADGTTVELTCLTRFGDGVLEELGAGFACAELTGGSLGEFVDYKDVTVDGSRLVGPGERSPAPDDLYFLRLCRAADRTYPECFGCVRHRRGKRSRSGPRP